MDEYYQIFEEYSVSRILPIETKRNFRFRILIMGTPHGWFKKISTRVHIDQILEACAQECPKLERLEIQWDQETLRWNENSSKFIDHIR